MNGSLNSALLKSILGGSKYFLVVIVASFDDATTLESFAALLLAGAPPAEYPNFIRSRRFCIMVNFALLVAVDMLTTDRNLGARSGDEKRRGLETRGISVTFVETNGERGGCSWLGPVEMCCVL